MDVDVRFSGWPVYLDRNLGSWASAVILLNLGFNLTATQQIRIAVLVVMRTPIRGMILSTARPHSTLLIENLVVQGVGAGHTRVRRLLRATHSFLGAALLCMANVVARDGLGLLVARKAPAKTPMLGIRSVSRWLRVGS